MVNRHARAGRGNVARVHSRDPGHRALAHENSAVAALSPSITMVHRRAGRGGGGGSRQGGTSYPLNGRAITVTSARGDTWVPGGRNNVLRAVAEGGQPDGELELTGRADEASVSRWRGHRPRAWLTATARRARDRIQTVRIVSPCAFDMQHPGRTTRGEATGRHRSLRSARPAAAA